ncbi:DUF3494 domain-containing protein [Microbacterium schleiferi]|uniref:DUF3494 domain-containing protein n=1 Tax=Microbacterium schleiferi TaxID=69362 RepID=A0A7S8RHT6_9MICO|nr:ice-binding family protein [Microbacterium schleiferi]QPE05771.1 DUF3494 domain-containing protein [Microbacterium schleiferi]
MVRKSRLSAGVLFAAVLVAGSAVMPASAQAVTTIDGPIGLGSAEPFAVLAGSTITVASNPTTTVVGDVGLSPGSSLTGDAFLTLTGTQHLADPVAAQAKLDLTTAYNTAASLTPATSGLSDLTGLSLVPGVYSGGALSLSGELTLAGSASSVWVFQAASTFTAGSSALVTLTGGASICNVFWQVGSSATLGAGSQLVGTIMADQSITAVTGAVVEGRLLARTGAVTLDTNTITRPVGCASSGGTVTTSPTITSGAPPEGTVGVAYSHTIESTGTPTVTYALSAGAVPRVSRWIRLPACCRELRRVRGRTASRRPRQTGRARMTPSVIRSSSRCLLRLPLILLTRRASRMARSWLPRVPMWPA